MSDRPRSKALPGILLSLSALIVGFLLGMWLGSFNVSKADGLAGGAIVLAWGLLGALVLLGGAIALWAAAARRTLWRVLVVLGPLSLIVGGLMVAGFLRQQEEGRRQMEEEMRRIERPTAPAAPLEFLPVSERAATEGAVVMGLGMARPDLTAPVLHFLNGPDATEASDSLVLEQVAHGSSIAQAPPWFVPAHLKLDYDILLLRVLAVSRSAVEVEVNGPQRMSRWVPRDQVQLLLWPEFLLGVYALEPLDPAGDPLRNKPLDHAAPITLPAEALLHPTVVRGQWMRVTTEGPEGGQVVEGWLRWTDGERLLVRYDLLS